MGPTVITGGMMQKPNPVFQQTLDHYLKEVRSLNLAALAEKLGLTRLDGQFGVRLLNRDYLITDRGFVDPSGRPVPYEGIVILSRYLLMCPEKTPSGMEPASYRDFKDSGPLTVYFSNDVENRIATHFAGGKENLARACRRIGGTESRIRADYDVRFRFDALPRIPVDLLFNDRDEEFEAAARLVFEKRAEHYLDAESLAILGNMLGRALREPDET